MWTSLVILPRASQRNEEQCGMLAYCKLLGDVASLVDLQDRILF